MVVAILAAMTVAVPDTDRVRLPAMEALAAGVEAPAVAPVVAAKRPAARFERFTPSVPAVPAPVANRLPVLRLSAEAEPHAVPALATSGLVARRLAPTLQASFVAMPAALSDSTGRQRPVLIDYSDAYYTRLKIHKWASWAMLPLFGLEYYTGQDLYNRGLAAPDWERNLHGPVAATLAGLFVVNTVTGGLNLWEGRKDRDGRAWRTTHGLLMLLADAGFVAVGMTAPENETDSGVFTPGSTLGESGGNQRLHRQIAIGSMAVAMVSWVMMLPPFRKE